MDAAVDDFLADPTASTLEGARRAWLIARDDYREVPGAFADGESYSLRHPKYQFLNLAFRAMHPETLVSPEWPRPSSAWDCWKRSREPTFSRRLIPTMLMATGFPAGPTWSGMSGTPARPWVA